MKRIILILSFCLLSNYSFAENVPDFNPKEINIKASIYYNPDNNAWSYKTIKDNGICFTKKVGIGEFGDYVNSEGKGIFTTNCDIDFIQDGKLIGYSNSDLKFYEFAFINGEIKKIPLLKEEIQLILPNYKIVPISKFSQNTNSIRVKMDSNNLKLFVLNDTEERFANYKFSSVNAKIHTYDLTGFIKVEKSGMVKFSAQNPHFWNAPIYVILIR